MSTSSLIRLRALPLSLLLVVIPAALPAAPPVISSFTSSKTGIVRGEAVTLNWNVTGATALTLRPPTLTVTGNAHSLTASGTQVYTLTATNSDGSTTAKVKLYDLEQKAFFTDTVLGSGRSSFNGFSVVEEFTPAGERVKKVIAAHPFLNSFYDAALAPGGDLLVTGHVGAEGGVLRYRVYEGTWTWHPSPGLSFGYASAADCTVVEGLVVFGMRSHRLDDFSVGFQVPAGREMVIGGDGQVHAPVVGGNLEHLDYHARQTGALLGRFSFDGVPFPLEDLSTGRMRVDATDVTADGERFIGTFGGTIFRLRDQPAVLQGSLNVILPGNVFRTPVFDVHVSPDGLLVAGMRDRYLLMSDRQFSTVRYIAMSEALSETYTAFTTTGLTRPRVEYFRAVAASAIPGASQELTWNVAGAASVDIEGVGTGLPPEGSVPVTVSGTTVFELAAENSWGQATAEAELLAGEPPVISFFTPTPAMPPLGEHATLAWSIIGANRAWISPGLGEQPADAGAVNYKVTQPTMLWLTAENQYGRRRAAVTITPGPPVNGSQYAELFPFSSPWSWLNPTNGVDPAVSDADFHTTWMKPASYNGPAFQGPSPAMFGYGLIDCCNITTVLTTPPTGLRYTAYFRKAFTVPEGVGPVSADAIVDDGFVIYVDGEEKGRRNYLGADSYRGLTPTFSNETSGGLTSLGVLPPGPHWLGVSVHNYTNDSSDLGLILRLFGTIQWYGLPPDTSGRRQITFEEAAAGAVAYTAGSNGTADAGWSQQAGNTGSVVQYPWGRAFHLSAGSARLTSDVIDLRDLINESARIDVKAFQTAGGNDYEVPDSIEAWVEGTSDGVAFTRITTLIPFRRGGVELVPPADQIAPLDTGEAGAFTRFTTTAGAIGPQWKAARIVIAAVNDHLTEHFIFDNPAIEGTPPSVDSDSDGLSDVWEQTWFAGLSTAGAGDADGDGQSNAAEQLAGTNPLLAASRLDYTAVTFPTPAQPGQLTWMSVPGKTYHLQYSQDMVTWENVETGIPADGATTTTVFPLGRKAQHRYCRVLANP